MIFSSFSRTVEPGNKSLVERNGICRHEHSYISVRYSLLKLNKPSSVMQTDANVLKSA